jgi:hypothetical protein
MVSTKKILTTKQENKLPEHCDQQVEKKNIRYAHINHCRYVTVNNAFRWKRFFFRTSFLNQCFKRYISVNGPWKIILVFFNNLLNNLISKQISYQ